MTAPVLLAVCLAGGIGAVGRYLVDLNVTERFSSQFPFGTLAVNLSGAFALGLVAGLLTSGDATRIAATGFLGAYTTFSTWMLETERLSEDDQGRAAAANVVVSVVFGVALAWAGMKLGDAL